MREVEYGKLFHYLCDRSALLNNVMTIPITEK
jgi:hypothetical protein